MTHKALLPFPSKVGTESTTDILQSKCHGVKSPSDISDKLEKHRDGYTPSLQAKLESVAGDDPMDRNRKPRFSHDFSRIRIRSDSNNVPYEKNAKTTKNRTSMPSHSNIGRQQFSGITLSPLDTTEQGVAQAGQAVNVGTSVPSPLDAPANPNTSVASTFQATRYAFAAPAFGQVSWNAHDPVATYSALLDGSNWRFRLESLALRVPVGVSSGGRTDVPSANSAVVTNATWNTVESDLRPAGGSPNRSPRTTYWAEDLTWKHEVFHFDEFNTFLKASFTTFENHIEGAGYTEATQAGDTPATALGRKQADLDSRLIAAWNQAKTNMSPSMEERAYADGVADYTARADAVKQRAVTEGW